jgi:hypothetical protein
VVLPRVNMCRRQTSTILAELLHRSNAAQRYRSHQSSAAEKPPAESQKQRSTLGRKRSSNDGRSPVPPDRGHAGGRRSGRYTVCNRSALPSNQVVLPVLGRGLFDSHSPHSQDPASPARLPRNPPEKNRPPLGRAACGSPNGHIRRAPARSGPSSRLPPGRARRTAARGVTLGS